MTTRTTPPRAVDPFAQQYLTRVATGEVGTGLSSKALALYALGLNPDLRESPPFSGKAEPRDPSDLRRCLDTYEAAPHTLRPYMHPVLVEWIGAVARRYPEPKGTAAEVDAYFAAIDRVMSEIPS